MSGPLIVYGDPHGVWEPLFDEAAKHPPGDLIIMGDLELTKPAREVLAPMKDWRVWWILGNHDCRTPQQLDHLIGKGGYPEGNLHGRVTEIQGRRFLGLGGTFVGAVWRPPEPVRFHTRRSWMVAHPPRWRGGLPVHMHDVIWPEDWVKLGSLRGDILITHEGPSSVWQDRGFAALDDLALRTGCTHHWHGHHHHSGSAVLPGGVHVRSVGKREAWTPWN